MGKSCFLVAAIATILVVAMLGFFGVLAGGVFYATSGVVNSADGFFSAVAEGEHPAARKFLSENYSNSLTDSAFKQLVSENRLDEYKTVFWNNRAVENSTGKLNGSITTTSGVSVPVDLFFIYERGKWKINSIEASNASLSSNSKLHGSSHDDITSDASTEKTAVSINTKPVSTRTQPDDDDDMSLTVKDIPDSNEAVTLVDEWTTKFCQSVSKKDFTNFLADSSPELQQQISPEQFANAFMVFIEQGLDLEWIKGKTPVFERKPSLNGQGILDMAGHYEAEPRVEFEYTFLRRSQKWKPLSVNIRVAPKTPRLELPKPRDTFQLASETTKNFSEAIQKKDFTEFHSKTSQRFQKKYSAAQFKKIFVSFIEKEADLSWAVGIDPVFDQSPALNMDGLFSMKGHFPTEPRVNFEYGFITEASSWKLISLDVSVPPEQTEKDNGESDE